MRMSMRDISPFLHAKHFQLLPTVYFIFVYVDSLFLLQARDTSKTDMASVLSCDYSFADVDV